MLKVKNNDIYFNRGETCALQFEVWNEDGTPFVLPPIENSLLNIATKIVHDSEDYCEEWRFYTPIYDRYGEDSGHGFTFEFTDIAEDADMQVHFVKNGVNSVTSVQFGMQSSPIVQVINEKAEITAVLVNHAKLIRFGIGSNISVTAREDKTMASVLALTVRASEYDDIVLTKYINLNGAAVYDGVLDRSPFGYNKFDTAKILPNLLEDMYGDMQNDIDHGTVCVYHDSAENSSGFYTLVQATADHYVLKPYKFSGIVPFVHEDTAGLGAGEYTYDLICYQGLIKNHEVYLNDEFPFEKVFWKKEIIPPHKFIIGDSNNA